MVGTPLRGELPSRDSKGSPQLFAKKKTIFGKKKREFPSRGSFQKPAPQELEVEVTKVVDYRGNEAIKRFYASVFQSPAHQSTLAIGRLKVKVIEASNLPAADMGGTSDPYCRVFVTGRNKHGEEWPLKEQWESKVVKKELNPMFHEETSFHIFRYDAIIRLEVFDQDNSSNDDLLGTVEIPVMALTNLGVVKRWFPLIVEADYTAPEAAVHLHLDYDVSALGEAVSMVWAEQPKKRVLPKFDINIMYAYGTSLQEEMAPYIWFAMEGLRAAEWREKRRSRLWLGAMLFVAFNIKYFWSIFHLTVIALLLYNLDIKRQVAARTCAIQAGFSRIDRDGSGTLDRAEIGTALDEISKDASKPKPTEDEIDAMFAAADTDKGGELCLEEFTQMCMTSPIFASATATCSSHDPLVVVSEDAWEEEDPEDEEAMLLASAVDNKRRISSPGSSHSSLSSPARPRLKLPSLRRVKDEVPEPHHCEVAPEKEKGVVKGMAKKLINLAGRKAGPAPAELVKNLGFGARSVAEVREVFEWHKFDVTLAFCGFNGFMACVHLFLPLYYVATPAVLCGFFALTEKCRALQRVVLLGPKAWRRFRATSRKDIDANSQKLLLANKRPTLATDQIFSSVFGSGNLSQKTLRGVVQAVFTRLDADGSGSVDAEELTSFFIQAMPNATPSAREAIGGSAHAVGKRVRRLVAVYDTSGDGLIDFEEFMQIVIKSGCAMILVQDELTVRLLFSGLKCFKLASNKSPTFGLSNGNWLRSHATSLFLTSESQNLDAKDLMGSPPKTFGLSYAKRDHERCEIAPGCVVEVKAGDQPQVLTIDYCSNPGAAAKTKTIFISISEALRDPLVDLLAFVLTGVSAKAKRRGSATSVTSDDGDDPSSPSSPPPPPEEDTAVTISKKPYFSIARITAAAQMDLQPPSTPTPSEKFSR